MVLACIYLGNSRFAHSKREYTPATQANLYRAGRGSSVLRRFFTCNSIFSESTGTPAVNGSMTKLFTIKATQPVGVRELTAQVGEIQLVLVPVQLQERDKRAI